MTINALLFFLILTPFYVLSSDEKWVVFYDDKAEAHEFEPYEVIVLDSDYYPALNGIKYPNKKVLGYISLGEVEKERPYFKAVMEEGIALQENIHWPGSYYIDVRDPRWAKRVIEEMIPNILLKKFDGLFFDTLDNPGELERENPEKFKGMVDAAVKLVKLIRINYPDVPIMMNRGYEVLPQVASDIDMELGESVFADYNFDDKTYELVDTELYQEQVAMLKDAQKINPKLKIYTLDYWDPDDEKGLKKIYAEQRKNGFIPYVATIDLHKIILEPKG